jgi:hypothetical protein
VQQLHALRLVLISAASCLRLSPRSCGTQAILNLILNLDDRAASKHGITLGDELKNFKEFTQGLPPDMRGEAISNSDLIRKAHNGFARPEPFIFEEKKSKDDSGTEDAFHFIGYVPINGKLYESVRRQRATVRERNRRCGMVAHLFFISLVIAVILPGLMV